MVLVFYITLIIVLYIPHKKSMNSNANDKLAKVKEKLGKEKEISPEERSNNIIKFWEARKPFTTVDSIPEYPLFNKKLLPNADELQKYVAKRFVELGALPKEALQDGHLYLGNCRNASRAIWNGKKFKYTRYKFGITFEEEINHFEDDEGNDVFVPIKDITK